jgi:hypothetical protein
MQADAELLSPWSHSGNLDLHFAPTRLSAERSLLIESRHRCPLWVEELSPQLDCVAQASVRTRCVKRDRNKEDRAAVRPTDRCHGCS